MATMHLTRTVKRIFEDAVMETHSLDIEVLTTQVCEILEKRYYKGHLEYNLRRLGMETTKDIRKLLKEYISLHNKRLQKKYDIECEE